MAPDAVDHLTRARAWSARRTPAERRAAITLALVWLSGVVLQVTGAHTAPGEWVAGRLGEELPSPAALAARLPPGDPRPAWYDAGLALREERERAASGPTGIDPLRADRADWDRLPGIGPRIAEAILALRAERGGFESPEDLLEVRGIGPVTLERIRPWLVWPEAVGGGGIQPERPASGVGAPRPPDLNRVDAEFLASLPRIGPHLAKTILRERGRRGGFRDWTEVGAIEGVGPSRLAVLQNATRIPNARVTETDTKSEGR